MIVEARAEVSASPDNRRLVDEQKFWLSVTLSGNMLVKDALAVVRAFAPVPTVVLEVGATILPVPPGRWES